MKVNINWWFIKCEHIIEMSTITYSMFEQVEAAHKLDGMKNASES